MAVDTENEGYDMTIRRYYWVFLGILAIGLGAGIGVMGCDNGTGVGATENKCDDGLDNDGDGDVDCADSDCLDDPACEGIGETECDDAIDNDGDGLTDCDDPDCMDDPACTGETEDCGDATDNDGDGLVDCDDPDCADNPACPGEEQICDDGVDNDADGDVDCADADCEGDPACPGMELVCDDEVDNDADGDVDCADADCRFDPACEGQTELDCSNQVDDDEDGDVDCDDSDCVNDVACGGTGLTCGQVLSCAYGCGQDFQCMQACQQSGCQSAQTLAQDYLTCAMMACYQECQAGLGDPACQTCSAAACPTELQACQADTCAASSEICDNGADDDGDGDVDCDDADCAGAPACSATGQTCSEVLLCAQGCGTDYNCIQACQQSGCPSAQQLSEDLVTCAMGSCLQSCMSGLSDPACLQCINANCSAEMAACQADTCAPIAEVCDNGMDDDQDGDIDCADSDCAGDPACSTGNEICDNGVDDDSDGDVDCADSDCANAPACSQLTETACGDGQDNDSDGDVDCADSDCASYPACGGSGWTCGETWTCVENCGTDYTCMQDCQDNACASGQAKAQDLLDCAQSACLMSCFGGLGDPSCQQCIISSCPTEYQACMNDTCTPVAEVCDNNLDDDQDGDVDCADSDCSGFAGCGAEVCDDGYDNDGDGDVDCADGDCAGDPACTASPEVCDDNIDNDNDGDTDCADSDCTGDPACATGGDTCSDILACRQNCTQGDTACYDACEAAGCASAQTAYNDLEACVFANCVPPCGGGNQMQCYMCIQNSCGTEYNACQNNTCP